MSKIIRMTVLTGCMSVMFINNLLGANIYCDRIYGGKSQEIRQICEECVAGKAVYQGTAPLNPEERNTLHKCIFGVGH